jgi:uncharacterized protein
MTFTTSSAEDSFARWLMADLLEWHAREARPEWFMYFQRNKEFDEQDFIDSGDCLGGLRLDGAVGTIAQSTIWRFRFPVDQDHKLTEGSIVCDPQPAHLQMYGDPAGDAGQSLPMPMAKTLGEVVAIDDANGTIDVKISNKQGTPTATAFVPEQPVNTAVMRSALQRLGQSILDAATSQVPSKYRGAISLLSLSRPVLRNDATLHPINNESSAERFIRLAPLLNHSHLIVQGPPGAGKTWALSRAVLACVFAGQRVGLSGFKHETMKTMLDGIRKALGDPTLAPQAAAYGKTVRAIRKVGDDKPQPDPSGFVTETKSNEDVLTALKLGTHQIAAGTSWLFSRPEMADFDVVFIDEAGQMSLANASAIATAAKSVVLVGDPQQLAQPGKGSHPLLPPPADSKYPFGSGASALEHVLASRATIPEDEGIFLDTTYRMHPEITRFISTAMYDGRLESASHCRNRIVATNDGRPHFGIRWCPVTHEGNKMNSPEEVQAVAKIVGQFVGGSLTNKIGKTRPIEPRDDIMLITPYNSQKNDLLRALPGFQVGTIDKFQGLESPIVIVSLVASSSEDIPRGIEFLYSSNRLNVAVSRAQTLCIVVGSPNLLAARCNSVQQMQLVNVFCKYVDMASEWAVE